jgi:hypothetical protein
MVPDVGSPLVADIEFPDTLLELERSAWAAIQAGALTVDQARAVQESVSAYAAEAGLSRYDVEMALKRAVRHSA